MNKTRQMCELMVNPVARANANRRTDAIAPAFPPGLSRPALRALDAAGYTKLAQLKEVPDSALLAMHGFGPKAIGVLRAALKRSEAVAKPTASRATKRAERTLRRKKKMTPRR